MINFIYGSAWTRLVLKCIMFCLSSCPDREVTDEGVLLLASHCTTCSNVCNSAVVQLCSCALGRASIPVCKFLCCSVVQASFCAFFSSSNFRFFFLWLSTLHYWCVQLARSLRCGKEVTTHNTLRMHMSHIYCAYIVCIHCAYILEKYIQTQFFADVQ